MSKSATGKSANGRKNVIDEGTTFKGHLTSASTVVVLGTMEGEISGPAVEVEDTGIIQGRAKVGELRSRGELAGEFEAEQVELSGRVRDQTVIRAKSLLVTPRTDGSLDAVFGECQIEVGEVPSKEQTLLELLDLGPAVAPKRSEARAEKPVAVVASAPPVASIEPPVARATEPAPRSARISVEPSAAARPSPPPPPPPRREREPYPDEIIERRLRRLQAERSNEGS